MRVNAIDDGWGYTAPIASYPAGNSPFGAQDMAGNVAEWVYDGYAPDFAALPGSRNPVYLESLEQRSVRGGHFASMIVDGHASNRFGYPPLTGVNNLGFRCASSSLVLPDPPTQDIYLDELILLSSTYVWSIDEGGLEGILGTLKSGKDVQVVAMHDNCAFLKIISPEFPDVGWILGPPVDKDTIFLQSCDGLEQLFFRPKNNAQPSRSGLALA